MGMVPAQNLFGVVDEHMSDGRELKHNHDEAERHPTSGRGTRSRAIYASAQLWPRDGRENEKATEKQIFGAEKAKIRLT